MDFDKYQKEAKKTAIYPKKEKFSYLLLGLAGETGEVCEKFKKIIRDKNSEINSFDLQEIKKELGDLIWYISQISEELEISFNDIAETNLEKLASRKYRGKIKGEGDNR